jgi:pilus assembly protein CpaB
LGITQVLRRGDPPPSDSTPIYVAKAEIATGALVNEDNVRLEQWPKEKVPAGAVSRQEDVVGRRARQKIFVDEPLIEPKLFARGQSSTEDMVPKGLRVVPVAVDYQAIHMGLVVPGTRCDLQVVITQNPGLGVSEPLCKTILQDIRVFAVNDVTSTEPLDPKAPETRSMPMGKTVSLLVTPAQSQIVTLASQFGTFKLILRNGEDREQPKTRDMTFRDMLGGTSSGGDRAKENPGAEVEKRFLEWCDIVRKTLKETAKGAPANTRASDDFQRFTMRVLTGAGVRRKADVSDVVLINDSGVQGLEEGGWTAHDMGPSLHNNSSAEAHGPAPVESGPAALPAGTAPPSKSDTLAPPTTPGSARSPAGG